MKNFSEGVRGYLFQGRFGSCVLVERHLLAAARYVELNPVSAGDGGRRGSKLSVVQCSHSSWCEQGDALVREKSLLGLVKDWGEYLKGNDEPRTQTTLL